MSKTLIYESDVKEAINSLISCKAAGLAIYDWSYYDESTNTQKVQILQSQYITQQIKQSNTYGLASWALILLETELLTEEVEQAL